MNLSYSASQINLNLQASRCVLHPARTFPSNATCSACAGGFSAARQELRMVHDMRHTPGGTYGFVTPGTQEPCGKDTHAFLPELTWTTGAFPATAFRAAETLAMGASPP